MIQKYRNSEFYYEIGILMAVFFWGINFVICKQALQLCNPWVFNAWRISISVSFLGAVLIFSEKNFKNSFHQAKTFAPTILFLGICGHFLYQLGFIQALQRTSVGNISLIVASAPIWTALFALFAKQEQLRKKAWLGLLISVLGTMIVVAGSGKSIDFKSLSFVGNLFALLQAVVWGLYTVISKPKLKYFSSTGLSFWTMLAALPFLWAEAVPHLATNAFEPFSDYRIWFPMLVSGLFSTGIAYILWNNAVHHVGASKTAIFSNLVPLIAMATAFFWLGEKIYAIQLFGGVCTLIGIKLMRS